VSVPYVVGASSVVPAGGWRANLPLVVGYLALFVLVAGLGGWGLTANISGAIVAPGRVAVEQSRQAVQHPEGGVVREILVHEGDEVRAGDVLVRLDDTSVRAELAAVDRQYFEMLARRGRLEAERDGRDAINFDPALVAAAGKHPEIALLMRGQFRLFRARLETLKREVDQLIARRKQITAQIKGMATQHAALRRQRQLILEQLEGQRKLLSQGLAQGSMVSALKREAARLEGEIAGVRIARAQAAGQAIEADIGILRLHSRRREEAISRLRDLRYAEAGLSEKRIMLADRLARVEIRAPVSGVVYGMRVHGMRAVIRPAEPLMYIIPRDKPLVVKCRVSPLEIDQVHMGQRVRLRFSAMSSRRTPALSGRVTRISADAYDDQVTRRSYYLVEIVPERGELKKLGKIDLLPGMPVTAFLKTVDRTPLDYLLSPLSDYFEKAFREG